MSDNSEARLRVAEGIAYLRSREMARGARGVTLQSSLADAIYALDSSQLDPIQNLTEGSPQYLDATTRVRKGHLQRIQDMKTLFFGGEGQPGLFDTLRKAGGG